MHTPTTSRHTPRLDIAALSINERIELAQQLWASVREEIETAPLTHEQITEITRRCAEIDSGGVQCVPFDTMMKRLER